ncbi:hypothetical protein C6Y45_08340 [Alkalicoccus saliphilus]|uniref:Uncharacterized protein n=1 Tax=Alkalicoccus saliphilus TaxID=200989 RepID=A0A2T4U6F9_9BACI|nr:hypothetical protein C6Y45_08340 [Alkalicoccus saliphilus]
MYEGNDRISLFIRTGNFFIIVLKPQGRLLQGKAPTEAKTNNLLYKKMCRNWKSLHEHLVMKAFH